MSRIGKAPVSIPKGVKAAVSAGTLTVEGPLGKLEHRLHPAVSIDVDATAIRVTRKSDGRLDRSVHDPAALENTLHRSAAPRRGGRLGAVSRHRPR